MKIIKKNRKFIVGKYKDVTLKDVASIFLKNDENVTFKNSRTEFDIVKKNWGYYGTPSLNKRLIKFGHDAALAKSNFFKTYSILLVEKGKKNFFYDYLKKQDMSLVCWLTKNNLLKIDNLFKKK